MLTLNDIKKRVDELYKTNPNIHMNVDIKSPKVYVVGEPVTITGVYPHIFQIEENYSGMPRRHCIQYNELYTKNIEIVEF